MKSHFSPLRKKQQKKIVDVKKRGIIVLSFHKF